jgi:hypothetical protein
MKFEQFPQPQAAPELPETATESPSIEQDGLSKEKLEKLQTLEFNIEADFRPLLSALNMELGFNLEPREDGFHITVITPPESKIINSLSADQIVTLQEINNEIKQGIGIEINGIGVIDGATAENIRPADREKKTAFLALSLPKLKAFRESLGLPEKDFHTTLGFSGGDIHMKVTGKDEKGKDLLAPIDKKADPALEKLKENIPELKFSALGGQERQTKK